VGTSVCDTHVVDGFGWDLFSVLRLALMIEDRGEHGVAFLDGQ
jgi:hypothetical protein